jgi:sugar phosphate isomerase/epimerase
MSIHRRKFLQTTASTTAAFMLSTLDSFSAPEPAIFEPAKQGYELLMMATSWGYTGSIGEFCAAAKKEGYDGIEVWWPTVAKDQEELFAALKKHNLAVGFLCGGSQSDPKLHLQTFSEMVIAATTQTIQQPVYINCHSGRDHFAAEYNRPFIELTNRQSKQTGIPIYHETHRGRMLFAAHITRAFIKEFADLRLTFDVSHWCNVHESLLDDQAETVAMALERVGHIHARIGHPEGPQVNDPRAPEWEAALKHHLAWWDTVVDRKRKAGEKMTILTEFGPPDYMPTLAYTRQPLADQWAINVHMMHLLRKRYQ